MCCRGTCGDTQCCGGASNVTVLHRAGGALEGVGRPLPLPLPPKGYRDSTFHQGDVSTECGLTTRDSALRARFRERAKEAICCGAASSHDWRAVDAPKPTETPSWPPFPALDACNRLRLSVREQTLEDACCGQHAIVERPHAVSSASCIGPDR